MKALILGCGYTGSFVAKKMQAIGYALTCTTRSTENFKAISKFCNHVVLWNAPDLETLFHLVKDTEVIFVSLSARSKDDFVNVYLKTAEAFLEIVKRLKKPRKLIYTSSTSVYKESNGGDVTEDSPLVQDEFPASVLVETENKFLSLKDFGWNVCIFRLSEIYGPGRDLHLKMKNRIFAGDGSRYTNMIHVEDIANATIFAIEKDLNGIYNLTDGDSRIQKELFQDICQKHSLPLPLWDSGLLSSHGKNKKVSNQKIIETGYKFLHPKKTI